MLRERKLPSIILISPLSIIVIALTLVSIIEASLASSQDVRRTHLLEQLKEAAVKNSDWARARRAARELRKPHEEAQYAELAGEAAEVVKRLRLDACLETNDYHKAAQLYKELGENAAALETEAKAYMRDREYDHAAKLYEQLLFIKRLYECNVKRAELRSPAFEAEEPAALAVFQFIGRCSREQLADLGAAEHKTDREKLAELCGAFTDAFAKVWIGYDPAVRETLLRWMPDTAIPESLDVDPLEFVAAMLVRTDKLSRRGTDL